MKIAIYARVSTAYREQNPETQLIQLRDYCRAQDWEVYWECVDKASAVDIAHRTAWRKSFDDAARRRFKLDWAFRSVKHIHDTFHTWEMLDIGFKSLREQFDNSTPVGRLLLNMLAALAEFELELIRERVKAGMDRARTQGKRIGRPRITEKRGFKTSFKMMLQRLSDGEFSRRQAARELGIG